MLRVLSDPLLEASAARARALRLARRLLKELGVLPARMQPPVGPLYEYVSVRPAFGRGFSVSIRKEEFEELARALGGRDELVALVKRYALAWSPDVGTGRSAYVRERLARRIKGSRARSRPAPAASAEAGTKPAAAKAGPARTSGTRRRLAR